ncbi:MAG: SDR family oxidoreductase [Gemmatimonadetes bacterium]|nr:SDR family oxidoreductase [Gemmatimonadota bacterium]MYB62466.1 SDR family oxidoreductase [Gemmatimonadota bacterium]
MKLEGRIALITGGGTGIGAATARLFAEEGAAVCVTGRRKAPLDEVVTAIEAKGGRAVAVTGDVAITEDCQRMVDQTTATFGKIDVLVNNAGTATLMDAAEITDELWDQTLATNLSGAFRMIRAVLPGMISRSAGSIVNVSSILAQSGMKKSAAYGASKAGLDQLTRVLAVEFADRGIRVNAVAPGWVDTPMTESVQAHAAMYQRLKKKHPMDRFGVPDEVAQAILFLASDQASFTTGSVLMVDGGWSAA